MGIVTKHLHAVLALNNYLLDNSISLTRFAQMVGKPTGTVSQWRRGKGRPNIHLADYIEELTGGIVPACHWYPVERPNPNPPPIPTGYRVFGRVKTPYPALLK